MKPEILRHLPTFVCAAEHRNFSAAARHLGVTPAAVSKSVRTLESRLGVRLFHRTTHKLTLTDDGQRLLERAGPLLAELDEAVDATCSSPERLSGLIRVAAPYNFGKTYIIPVLRDFCTAHPEVELDLRLEDHVIDLVEERIDVSVGVRMSPAQSLVARRLCDSRLFTVAAPSLVERLGVPSSPADLRAFPCLRYRSPSTGSVWPWWYSDPDSDGVERTIDLPSKITCSNQEALCELAAAGHGVTMVGWVALSYLCSGVLVALLERYAYRPPPIMLFFSSKEHQPPRVRALIDWIYANMSRPIPPSGSGWSR
jgi:DNA-binding transcriptional LysR family regulator